MVDRYDNRDLEMYLFISMHKLDGNRIVTIWSNVACTTVSTVQ